MELDKNETVLIVEDYSPAARLMERVLSPQYRVKVAEGVLEGFNILTNEPVKLVLLDISLPGLSGFELFQRIKSDASLCHVPVIFVTGYDSFVDKQDVLRAGMDDFLAKPFRTDELMAKVRAALHC